jgi:hypothetical protein
MLDELQSGCVHNGYLGAVDLLLNASILLLVRCDERSQQCADPWMPLSPSVTSGL